jgi:predicted enzyme related to lactoylglutathione lyase
MEMLKDSIFWAEIPVTDFERAKQFYSTIYDYDMPEIMMGPNRMGFLLHERGVGIGVAIVQGKGYTPSKEGVKIYLNGGSNLALVLNRVETAGGKIIMPKTQISPQFGCLGVFEDSEGNQLSIHSLQ